MPRRFRALTSQRPACMVLCGLSCAGEGPWTCPRTGRHGRLSSASRPARSGGLVAALVLIALLIVVFAGGMHGLAVDVSVADDAVARWLGKVHPPGLLAVERGLAAISSWWVLNGLAVGVLLVLLALRRFRHLIVLVILANLVTFLAGDVLGAVAQRPRPFGVVIRASWGGWALPPLQVTVLAFALVAVLYTLVPEGRWRNRGKWVATGLVALAALPRIALGAEAPTDVLVGVAIGVTIPLLVFRLFLPNELFPVTYRRGRAAHPDAGAAWTISSAWSSRRSSRSGWRARAALPPCASLSRASSPATCSPSCTPRVICAPTAGTSSAGSCCTAGWRTKSRSTLCGGWCSRRTTRCGCAGTPGCRAPPRSGLWSSRPTGSTCWSPRSSTAPSSSARPPSTTGSSTR